ncbi:hypothetical protein BsWGS_07495 [Bradybaena similaris]
MEESNTSFAAHQESLHEMEPRKPDPTDFIWSYRDLNAWQDNYQMCVEKPASRQSPINIDTKTVEYRELPVFSLSEYNTLQGVIVDMINTGNTAILSFSGAPIEISGGGLRNAFRLENVHFHWGASSASGSEHQIDSRCYPMEMHIVHYNTTYPDVRAAACEPGGLAVLAFLFKVTRCPNPAYSQIVSKLEEITMPGLKTQITPAPLQNLLPKKLGQFYRYEGSLTTPPCNETVTWSVFAAPIPISERQIACFRSLKSLDINPETNDNFPLVDNTRPPQSLNGRVVYANFRTHQSSKKKSFIMKCSCLSPD